MFSLKKICSRKIDSMSQSVWLDWIDQCFENSSFYIDSFNATIRPLSIRIKFDLNDLEGLSIDSLFKLYVGDQVFELGSNDDEITFPYYGGLIALVVIYQNNDYQLKISSYNVDRFDWKYVNDGKYGLLIQTRFNENDCYLDRLRDQLIKYQGLSFCGLKRTDIVTSDLEELGLEDALTSRANGLSETDLHQPDLVFDVHFERIAENINHAEEDSDSPQDLLKQYFCQNKPKTVERNLRGFELDSLSLYGSSLSKNRCGEIRFMCNESDHQFPLKLTGYLETINKKTSINLAEIGFSFSSNCWMLKTLNDSETKLVKTIEQVFRHISSKLDDEISDAGSWNERDIRAEMLLSHNPYVYRPRTTKKMFDYGKLVENRSLAKYYKSPSTFELILEGYDGSLSIGCIYKTGTDWVVKDFDTKERNKFSTCIAAAEWLCSNAYSRHWIRYRIKYALKIFDYFYDWLNANRF